MIESLSWITLGFATISAVFYVRNQSAFRKSPAVPSGWGRECRGYLC